MPGSHQAIQEKEKENTHVGRIYMVEGECKSWEAPAPSRLACVTSFTQAQKGWEVAGRRELFVCVCVCVCGDRVHPPQPIFLAVSV